MNKLKKPADVSKSAETACYAAILETGIQVSPDDFVVDKTVKRCNSETTVKEIFEWAAKHDGRLRSITLAKTT